MTRPDLRPLDVEPVSVRFPFDVRQPLVRDVAAGGVFVPLNP